MFGLGTTKPRRLDRFSSEHWVVVQGENGGAPMVLRINSGAAKYAAHPELPIRLGVTVAFNAPNGHGFCTPEEGEQLNQIEDQLVSRLQAGHAGFPVLVVTCGGKREFIYYVRDEQQASNAVEVVRDRTASHDLLHGLETDRKWLYYSQLAFRRGQLRHGAVAMIQPPPSRGTPGRVRYLQWNPTTSTSQRDCEELS